MSIETSIIVEFVGSEQGVGDTVVVELDRDHPDNLDTTGELKSSFTPDDQPVILVHHASHLEILAYKCTHGSVLEIGQNQVRERENSFLFTTDEASNSLGYAAAAGLGSTWKGNNGVAEIDGGSIIAPSGVFPCYGDFTYNVTFQRQYRLCPPTNLVLVGDETYSIYVVIYIGVV